MTYRIVHAVCFALCFGRFLDLAFFGEPEPEAAAVLFAASWALFWIAPFWLGGRGEDAP